MDTSYEEKEGMMDLKDLQDKDYRGVLAWGMVGLVALSLILDAIFKADLTTLIFPAFTFVLGFYFREVSK